MATKPCDVCYGTPGRYPIINRFGQTLFQIPCPECMGTGLDEPMPNRQTMLADEDPTGMGKA